MFSSAVVSLALAASALANVFVTYPVATSTLTAGQPATLTWIDDGTVPSLTQFGNATFAIYVGNAFQQTPLQTIATSVDVSGVSSLVFTPDGTVGPNSDEYFIRATSRSYMNPSSPQYYEEVFSAKFNMVSMTGSFNASIQAEINGQSTAPIGGTTTGNSPLATATGVSMTTMASSSASSSPATTSAAATSSTNGAGKPIIATGFVALAAALVGASFL